MEVEGDNKGREGQRENICWRVLNESKWLHFLLKWVMRDKENEHREVRLTKMLLLLLKVLLLLARPHGYQNIAINSEEGRDILWRIDLAAPLPSKFDLYTSLQIDASAFGELFAPTY